MCQKCGGNRERDKNGEMRCIPCRRESSKVYSHTHFRTHIKAYKTPQHSYCLADKCSVHLHAKSVWQPVWAAQSRKEIVDAVRDYRKAAKSLGVGV